MPCTPPAWRSIGHEVLGVDSDTQKIAALQEGHAPFFEPGLEEILVRAVALREAPLQHLPAGGRRVRRRPLHLRRDPAAARRRPAPT